MRSDTRTPAEHLQGLQPAMADAAAASLQGSSLLQPGVHLVSGPAQTTSLQLQRGVSSIPFANLRHDHAIPAFRSPASIIAASVEERKSLGEVLSHAGRKALGGGVPAMAAMATQVLTLMWLRTTVNYQYRYGTGTMQALRTLYKEGGIPRFYRGLAPALIQGPLSRFGDTAANEGMLALLASSQHTRDLPVGVKTLACSLAAGGFRIFLMPVDTVKTIMQVEGNNGLPALAAKFKAGGLPVFYHGALAASAATFVGHYPWFATYNYLNAALPRYEDDLRMKLLRSAFIGFCASFISDCSSNSIRVIKTTRQTSKVPMSYSEAAKAVIAQDGIIGLFGRGLATKIIANGMQGITFTVLWRLGQDYWHAHTESAPTAAGEQHDQQRAGDKLQPAS